MLQWLFGFRGVAGRVRFLAGLSLLTFSALALVVVVAVIAALVHVPTASWSPALALILFVLIGGSFLGLATRRLRDVGWPPLLVLGGLVALTIVEWWSPLAFPSPWRELMSYPAGALAWAGLWLVLLVWPGRTPEGELRGGGVLPGAAVATLLAVVGLGLIVDPFQGKACPVYGASAPSDDCESLGVVGRVYSTYLIIDAHKQLDQREPARARRELERAIAVRPGFVYAYNSLGLAYDQMNDSGRALAAYDHALTLRPRYAHGLINRAMLLDKLGQRPRALADLREILRHEPDNAAAKQGVAYMTGGR